MQYKARAETVVGTEVKLPDYKPMMAVAIGSEAMLVPVDVFDFLFRPVDTPLTLTSEERPVNGGPGAGGKQARSKAKATRGKAKDVERQGKRARRGTETEPEEPAADPPARKTLAEWTVEALSESPKTNQEVIEYVKARTETTDNSVTQNLYTMQKRNEIAKGGDLKWKLVRKTVKP